VEGDTACCGVRTGGTSAIELIPVAELASTPEKALAKCAGHFAAMLTRPLLTAKAGETVSTAAANFAKINPATGRATKPASVTCLDAAPGAESQPEPLAGPKHRAPFSYANA
jgi:hypothetical protein